MVLEGNPFPEMNLNISLPKLKHFEFDTWDYESCMLQVCHPSNLTLMNLSSLATADIKILISSQVKLGIRTEVPEICARRAVGLLRGIRNVEVLTLDHNFIKALGGAPDILDNLIFN